MARKKRSPSPEPVYHYRPGSGGHGIPADVAGPELKKVADAADGHLTPEATVAAATPPDSPLHPAFTWDDQTAAHNYRLGEARQLIRAVYVTYPEEPDATPVPIFVHTTGDGAGSYQPTEVVVRDHDLYASALESLNGILASAKRSVSELREAARIMKQPARETAADAAARHLAAARESLATV